MILKEKNLQRNLHLHLHLHIPTTKTPTTTLQPVKNAHIQNATSQNYSKMLSSNQETEPVCQTLQDCPPLASLMNVAPSSDDEHCAPAVNKTTTIKTMKLCLPHPKILDVLPSPTNKWSATIHPIKGWMYGFFGYHIFYKHFYFHDSRVLHMKAFVPSTTAITVGDGGNPRGSTELDEVTGHSCAMSQDEYNLFTLLVLGLQPD